MKKLLQRIRDQQAQPQEKLSLLPEEVDQFKQEMVAAEIGPQEYGARITGKGEQNLETGELIHRPTERLAEQLAGIVEVTWEMLRVNAEKIRKRKTGKPYTPGWHRNLTTLLKTVDFKPQGLTPERIARSLAR